MFDAIGSWFKRARRSSEADAPQIPAGIRAYAIGDIHGRADLLDQLMGQIAADRDACNPEHAVLIFLGDYVDRGLNSREVLDYLIGRVPSGFEAHFLLGNHEASVLSFLKDPVGGQAWLDYGGVETLLSYGVRVEHGPKSEDGLGQLCKSFAARLPERHKAFLEGLEPYFELGDFLFVHAGVRPGVPLDKQRPYDLMWIREEFLESTADHGHIVVHGHTPQNEPDLQPNRIGIDTGAYLTGRLTALILEKGHYGFLTT